MNSKSQQKPFPIFFLNILRSFEKHFQLLNYETWNIVIQ